MTKRSTIVLTVIAAVLFAAVLYDQGRLSTGELAARRGRVIEAFVRPRVSRLEISHGDTRIVLVRHQEEEETLDTFDVGTWTLAEPIESGADADAVDGVLSAMEWLDARRTLTGMTAEDRTRFGLDEPRARVAFRAGEQDFHIAVGGEDPRGEGIYVSGDDPAVVWIVGRDFFEALDHDADHFREKDLFPRFRSRDAQQVELTNVDTHVVVERAHGRFHMIEPVDSVARAATVEAVLSVFADVRATRFLAETLAEADAATWGLATPTREVSITREDEPPLRFRVGGPCPDHEGELVALAGDGPVVCIGQSDVESLDVPLDRLRETRLVATADDRVESVELRHGDDAFTVRRNEGDWEVQVGDAAARPADESAVGELMRGLRAQEAEQFVPASEENLAAHGFTAESGTLTIHRTDEDVTEVVHVGSEDTVGIWVRRGDEAQIARFTGNARELLSTPAITFRSRRLAEREADDAEEVRITRGATTEVAASVDGQWRVREPVSIPADGAIVRDVAGAVGSLEAVRFVADHAAPEHGLDHPRYAITVRFAAAEDEDADHDDHEHHDDEAAPAATELIVHLGAETSGGAFATFGDDPAVFVAPASLVSLAAGPLASRDLFAISTSGITSITITGPNGTVALTSTDGTWTTPAGPAAEAPTTGLLDRLASLRAVGVEGYGAPLPGAPFVTIELTREGSSPTRLEIGPRVEAPTPHHIARMTDVGATLWLSTEIVDAFAAYRP
jgi:hypothetical protein